jgi:hypothetical protein
MTWKASELASTHFLESAVGWTSQGVERKRAREGHSLSGECRGIDASGCGKEASEQGALTNWRARRDGLVRTWKASKRARGTHCLESAEGWTSQDMESKRAREGHSLTGESRGMDQSEHGKRAREGHSLPGERRWTCQNMESKRANEVHSHPGESRGTG